MIMPINRTVIAVLNTYLHNASHDAFRDRIHWG